MTGSDIDPGTEEGMFLKHPRPILVLLGLFWIGLNLWALQRYPSSNVDEAWIGSIAVEYSRSGRFGLPIFTDVYGSSENYGHMGRLYAVALAAVYALLGVGFWQGRLFALIGIGISGWLLFQLGARLYGRGAGLAAAGIFLWSWRVFSAAHLTRPEPWVVAGSLTCVIGLLHFSQSRSKLSAFGVGLLAGLVINIYLTGVYASIAVSAMVVWLCRRRKDWPQIFWYSLGGFLGLLYWLLANMLPDPALAVKQWQLIATLSERSPDQGAILDTLGILHQHFWANIVGYTRLGIVELVCVAIGSAGLLLRRSRADYGVILFLIPFTLAYVLIAPGKGPHHLVLLSPIAALIVAAGLQAVTQWLGRLTTRVSAQTLQWSLIAGLVLMYIGGDVILAWRNRDIDYQGYAARLHMLIPSGSHVFGESGWYFALSDYHYTIDENLYFNVWALDDSRKVPADEILRLIIRERGINTILVDERLSANFPDGDQTQEESALRRYVTEHCRSIGSVSGVMYGAEWAGGPAVKTTDVFVCP